MTKEKQSSIVLEIIPTVLPDYNLKNQLGEAHETSEISVARMKHKHIRQMQTMDEAKQIHYIMSELTGLTARDLDELDAEDSASLSEIIFGYMKKYADIAKQMMA